MKSKLPLSIALGFLLGAVVVVLVRTPGAEIDARIMQDAVRRDIRLDLCDQDLGKCEGTYNRCALTEVCADNGGQPGGEVCPTGYKRVFPRVAQYCNPADDTDAHAAGKCFRCMKIADEE